MTLLTIEIPEGQKAALAAKAQEWGVSTSSFYSRGG